MIHAFYYRPLQTTVSFCPNYSHFLFSPSRNNYFSCSPSSSPMFFRKPSPIPPLHSLPSTTTLTFSKSKDLNHNNKLRYTLFSCLFLVTWLLVLHHLWFTPTTTTPTTTKQPNKIDLVKRDLNSIHETENSHLSATIVHQKQKPSTTVQSTKIGPVVVSLDNIHKFKDSNLEATIVHKKQNHTTTCDGSRPLFYIYNLPSRFNLGLLQRCESLNIYTNMCPHVANNGLGQPLSTPSWYATNQFMAEMIIHARLENHPCRTWDPDTAALFYVPFYGGLHASSMFRESNHTLRDSLAVDLVDFLQSQPWWKRRNGKDHFVPLGRTAWDFMRTKEGPDFGANMFLNLPPVQNMSVLIIERQPWQGRNQFGIPYPSYFHPQTLTQTLTWQSRMRQHGRPYLFSFIGGTRKGLEKAKLRDYIVAECTESKRCVLILCGSGNITCHDPMKVLEVMSGSVFCLQAPGDSFTRRSTFDSVLAGCIPVFFSEHTAYTQYKWYFPTERDTYSVFIDEREVGEGKKRIEDVLMSISDEKVKKMQENVIGLIPKITYAHPNASGVGFEDVVDVALQQLSQLKNY